MIKKIIIISFLILFFIIFCYSSNKSLNTNSLFPDINGLKKIGDPKTYIPSNLFEYINGAAELYISFNFQKLVTLSYEGEDKESLTIDIYNHSDLKNAFGIYAQEKPYEGNFLDIGVQGYYDRGILNFLKGSYYVKISSFGLGDKEESLIKKTAKKIADNLEGETTFPTIIKCFPDKAIIENSQRYVSENFMGHSFLHSAFVADYKINNEKRKIFIIKTKNKKTADAMLEEYLNLAKSAKKQTKTYRFEDPYYKSSGLMNIMKKDNYIWGMLGNDTENIEYYLGNIKKNLIKHKLLTP